AVVRLPDPKRKIMGKKGIDCIFVGYAEHSNAYRFYVIKPNDFVSINSIIESRDAIFDENRFSSIHIRKDIIPNVQESQMLVVRKEVDAIAWWIDTGATTHVCKDHCWFKTFEPVEDGYIGDEHFALVHGNGSVALEFSFGKTVTLFNVFYVPKRRKNLVYGPVLNKCGYKQVYESDKAVVRLPDPKRKIMGKKGIDCIFVGYAEHSNAYRFYVIKPNDFVSINSIIESRDAIFDENRFSSIHIRKDIIPNVQESQMLVVRKEVDAIAWWIDTGATTHVCKDHCWFKTFEPVEDGY
nr:zinc finger, CCHC-type [Tanacetum cinerariifolium]